MYALIEIIGRQTRIELFEELGSVEREMKKRYTKLIKEAKNIDWENTWFDEKNLVARVDDYRIVIEYRGCEIKGKRDVKEAA